MLRLPSVLVVVLLAILLSTSCGDKHEFVSDGATVQKAKQSLLESRSGDAAAKIATTTCDGKAAGTTEQRIRYDKTSVPSGDACLPEVQLRVCNSGKWSSWSGSYLAESCLVQKSLDCPGGTNGALEKRTRYKESSVAFGSSCTSEIQTRSCDKGQWSSWSGTFEEGACAAGEPIGCGSLKHGSYKSRVQYQSTSVGFGQSCQGELQVRFCNNGKLEAWSGTFGSATCAVQPPAACSNPTISHGGVGTRVRYKEDSPEFGNTCESEVQVASCYNGRPSGFSGSFAHDRCEVQAPKSCSVPDAIGSSTKSVPHGGNDSRVVYESAQVSFGQQCKWEVLSGVCNNGALEYGKSSFATPQTACVVKEAAPCIDSKGSKVASGTTESFTKYFSTTVKFGESCQSEVRTRTCNNGTWSAWTGSFNEESCKISDPLGCGTLAHGDTQSKVMFKDQSVAYGQQCSTEVQTQTCNNGVFSTWSGSFQNVECSVLPPLSCGTTSHNQLETRVRYANESVPFGSDCQSEVQTRLCSNGIFSDWSGTLQSTSCKVQAAASCEGNVPSGTTESRTRYLASSVPFGQDCQDEIQTRTCNNGTFSNWSGMFAESACKVDSTATTQTPVSTATVCAADEGYVSGLGCLYKDGARFLIGVIKQNEINPTQVATAIRPDDVSKVIDDTRWMSIWNAADNTTIGNWRLVAQMETSTNVWESNSTPPANNIHLMKNANRLPLVKSLSAPVLTAYVYSLFHHEDSGATWTGLDYSGIIYGGTGSYRTFGWYNQAATNNFFNSPYSYASKRMRLWIYPPPEGL
jgi:hypothetical protein